MTNGDDTSASDAATAQTEDARQKISRWLEECGCQVTESADERFYWRLIVTDEVGVSSVIVQWVGRPEEVMIQGVLVMTPSVQERFEALDSRERNEMLWDVRFKLIDWQLFFDGVFEPLEKILINQFICYDGLTMDRLLVELSSVSRAVIGLRWMFERKLGIGLPDRSNHGRIRNTIH